MNEQTILSELKDLKKSLQIGDDIITEISPSGKEIKTSKKVGDARIKVLNMIKDALANGEITGPKAGELTRLFGEKTKSIFWIK